MKTVVIHMIVIVNRLAPIKKPLLTAALGTVFVSAFAQGTLDFANAGPGYVAEVYDIDGVTGLAGSAWSADLYWTVGTVTDSTLLTALNEPSTFSTVPAQAGFFFGNTRTLPGTVAGETITAQVRVWDTASGNSWAAASTVSGARVGASIVFQVVGLGGPTSGPPLTPAFMTGLNGYPWSVSVVSVFQPTTMNYQVSGGSLMLSWSQGVLQSSSQIDGTYVDITSATSPYHIPIDVSASQKFYRVRIP